MLLLFFLIIHILFACKVLSAQEKTARIIKQKLLNRFHVIHLNATNVKSFNTDRCQY